jgi:hypothetical protein
MEKELKQFSETRVVTKDIITDSFQGIRNLFGLRLRGYESIINKETNKLMLDIKNIFNVKWFRFSINPLVSGSIMITLYGEGYKK